MAEGRQRCEWDQTSALLAQVANHGMYFLAKRPRAYEPAEFNPTLPASARRRQAKKTMPPAQALAVMKYLWTKAK